jgi:hypothetical protein
MTRPWAHLTRNEYCLTQLDIVLDERHLRGEAAYAFAVGFIAGWQERPVNEHARGMTTVNRDYLAALETAANARKEGDR